MILAHARYRDYTGCRWNRQRPLQASFPPRRSSDRPTHLDRGLAALLLGAVAVTATVVLVRERPQAASTATGQQQLGHSPSTGPDSATAPSATEAATPAPPTADLAPAPSTAADRPAAHADVDQRGAAPPLGADRPEHLDDHDEASHAPTDVPAAAVDVASAAATVWLTTDYRYPAGFDTDAIAPFVTDELLGTLLQPAPLSLAKELTDEQRTSAVTVTGVAEPIEPHEGLGLRLEVMATVTTRTDTAAETTSAVTVPVELVDDDGTWRVAAIG